LDKDFSAAASQFDLVAVGGLARDGLIADDKGERQIATPLLIMHCGFDLLHDLGREVHNAVLLGVLGCVLQRLILSRSANDVIATGLGDHLSAFDDLGHGAFLLDRADECPYSPDSLARRNAVWKGPERQISKPGGRT
jgi:hypothetical protein